MAPFHYISDATIVNLVTAGSVSAGEGGDNSSGLVGCATNSTIKSCRSSVAISQNLFKPITHLGGLVGSATGTLTITDCLFDGQLLKSSSGAGLYHGGFVGDGTASITNSLFAPASVTVLTQEGGTFSSGGGTFTNCYYTQTLGTAQGISTSGMTGDDLLAALGSGWEISGDKVVPKMEVNLDIHNPVFDDVLVSDATANVETQYVDFVGNSSSVDIAGEDRSIVYLGAGGSLYYPNAAMQIGSCRAYFQLKGLSADDNASEVRAFRLNFGDDATTGVIAMDKGQGTMANEAGAWYLVDGRRLDGKPTARGIYVNNGRKVFIK